jgi:hypothetical protein
VTSQETTQERWQAEHPGQARCDVYRVSGGIDCAGVSVAWFTATCEDGHYMQGNACQPCRDAKKTGCAACRRSRRRYVPVLITFLGLVPS